MVMGKEARNNAGVEPDCVAKDFNVWYPFRKLLVLILTCKVLALELHRWGWNRTLIRFIFLEGDFLLNFDIFRINNKICISILLKLSCNLGPYFPLLVQKVLSKSFFQYFAVFQHQLLILGRAQTTVSYSHPATYPGMQVKWTKRCRRPAKDHTLSSSKQCLPPLHRQRMTSNDVNSTSIN